MDDKADRRFDYRVADQPIRRLVPIFGKVTEFVVIDDHQQIEIRSISLHRERFIDPATFCIGPKEDDLEDPPPLFEVCRPFFQGVLKLLMQDFQGTGQFSLLLRRDVIEGGFHHWQGDRRLCARPVLGVHL